MFRKLAILGFLALLAPSDAQACPKCQAQAAVAQQQVAVVQQPVVQAQVLAAQPAVLVTARAGGRQARVAARRARKCGAVAVAAPVVATQAVVQQQVAPQFQLVPQAGVAVQAPGAFVQVNPQQYRMVPVGPDEAPAPAEATDQEQASAQQAVVTAVPQPVAPPSAAAFQVQTFAYAAPAIQAPTFAYATAPVMAPSFVSSAAAPALFAMPTLATSTVFSAGVMPAHVGRRHLLPYRAARP